MTSDPLAGVGGFGSAGQPFVDGGLFPALVPADDHVWWWERPVLLDGGEGNPQIVGYFGA